MTDYEEYGLLTVSVIFALIAYMIFNVAIEFLNVTYGPRLTDFDTYYYSAKRFLEGGSLYADSVAPDGSSRRFMYPPIAVVIFIPFSFLPFTAAGILWNTFSLAFLAFGIRELLTELAKESEVELTTSNQVVILLSVIGFSPMINWVKAGQASGLVAGGLCLSVAFLLKSDRTSNKLSAVYTSVSIPIVCAVKPYYAPSGAHLLQSAKRFTYAVAGGLTIAVLSLVIFGVEEHASYFTEILTGNNNLVFTTPPSQWNASIYSPFYVFGDFAAELRYILLLVTVITVLLLQYRGDERLETALLGIAIIPMATPTRVDGLVALIPVYLVLLFRYWTSGQFRVATLVSIVFIHIHPYTIELVAKLGPRYVSGFGKLTPIIPILQPALWGHLLLLFLLAYRIVNGDSRYGGFNTTT